MKKIKKSKLFLGTAALSLLLAACGTEASDPDNANSSDSGTNSENTASSEPTSITWMAILHNPTPPTDVIIDKIEEYTDTELTFNWMPAASYEERLTTSLASDTLADIITVAKMGNSTVRSSMKNGMFWDVSPYLKDYKNLSEIPEGLLDSVRVDGQIPGIPMQKAVSRAGFAIRKDWLDNLGLEIPTTMDELYEVARAFTEDDPDGNGIDDTIGIVDRGFNDINFTSFKQFVSYYGGPSGWQVNEDGSFTHQSETQAYKDAMNFSKKLYENGYLNQDFAVTQKGDQNDWFSQGRFGIYPGAGAAQLASYERNAKDLQPEMDLVGVNKISGDGTENYRVWAEGNGLGGLIAFPKSEVKDEARLRELLEFVDKLLDEDPFMWMTYGIEGEHYTVNEKGEVDEQDIDKFTNDVQALTASRPSTNKHVVAVADPKQQESDRIVAENEQFVVLDPSIGLDSATQNQLGSEIQKLIVDATVQYIMGQIDESQFDAAIEEWRQQGGTKIAEEYAESYKQNRGS